MKHACARAHLDPRAREVPQVRESRLRAGDGEEDARQLAPAAVAVLVEEVIRVVRAQALIYPGVIRDRVVYSYDDVGGEPEDDDGREDEADAARAEGLRGEEGDHDRARDAHDDA